MVTYKTTNTCQSFDQFQVVKNDNNIIELGVVGKQRGGNDCKEKEEEKIQEYAITPAKAGEYTFRFWAGKILITQINLLNIKSLFLKNNIIFSSSKTLYSV